MSNERRQRLERLMELRGKQLDQRVAELQSARSIELSAAQMLEEAQTQKMTAILKRDERAKAGLQAGEWGHAENWLTRLAEQEALVEQRRQQAARVVEEARTRVSEAKSEQEKIQVLIRRAVEEAKQIAARASHKQDDEFGARFANRKAL